MLQRVIKVVRKLEVKKRRTAGMKKLNEKRIVVNVISHGNRTVNIC